MIYLIFSLYAIVLIIFTLVYFFIVYHLVKYGAKDKLSKIILPLFIVISVLLLFSNIFLFFSIDWNNLIANFFPLI